MTSSMRIGIDDNAPSNGICRKLGFSLVDELDVEYAPGNFMRRNDRRLDLLAEANPAESPVRPTWP
jgi:hypothetical protein